MTTSATRSALLQSRLGRLASATTRVLKSDAPALAPLRDAIWRMRELLPILQLPPATVQKLDARLRKTSRRLEQLRRLDSLLALVDDLAATDRRARQAETRINNELRRRRAKLGPGPLLATSAADLHKALERIEALGAPDAEPADSAVTARAMRWAVKARAARRAATLRDALADAGAVYLPGRLRAPRTAVRRLLFCTDLLGEIAGPLSASDHRAIVRMRDALDRLRDAEALIVRVRQMQAAVTPPELKVWQELDGVVLLLENRCRRWHARYLRDRASLQAVCDRLTVRPAAQAAAKRKVS